jgi:hypothetical protein
MKTLHAKGFALFAAVVATVVQLCIEAAPPIQVTAADPSSAPQGTLSLDVAVAGNGFDSSAAVDFLVTGTTNPGGITVRNVSVVSPKKLVATIDVADIAVVASFDIQVTQSGGRKGKGTSLFAVQSKATSDPCAQASLDFPAFAFRMPAGNGRQFILGDATGSCTRDIYYTTASVSPPVLSYPVAGSSNRGRVVWFENITRLVALDFTVSGSQVTVEPPRTILAWDSGGGWGLDMSSDGEYVYTATETNIVERISVANPADRLVLRQFDHDSRRARVESVNGNESALYLRERVLGVNGETLSSELVRLDLLTLTTNVIASRPGDYLFYAAADTVSGEIVYTDYLDGFNNCYLLQIADGVTGTTRSYGQPRYGRYSTWHRGKILTMGYKPPDRRGKCASMDMIVEIDPNTSAQRDVTRGDSPNGS